MDAMLLTVEVVLGGGCKCSDTRRTPFPLLVADGLQWKGKRGQTVCTGGKLNGPGAGNILRLICQEMVGSVGSHLVAELDEVELGDWRRRGLVGVDDVGGIVAVHVVA